MKICHVTTFWPNHLGHTHYTDNLIRAMRAHDPTQHIVLGEHPSAAAETDAYRCVPCFRRSEDYVPPIVAAVRAAGADVAIVQYSNDLFGEDNRLPRLVHELRQQGVKVVVNSHSVYPERRRTGYRPERTAAAFDRALAAEAALITVHSRRMKDDLIARGIPSAKVAVIPHGSKAIEERDPAESRVRLGIPEGAKVVLFFGFVWLGKGIDFLLGVFADVLRRVPDAFLYIGGHTRHQVWSFYMSYLRARMRLLGISSRSLLSGGYVPDDLVPTVYSAADVVAMPYRQDYSSVSGVVHQTVGVGKLLLCSRISKFDEVTESIDPALTVGPHDRRAWADTMVRLLTDEAWAAGLRTKIRAFGEATSWQNVGRLHLDTYRRLLDGDAEAEASGPGAAAGAGPC